MAQHILPTGHENLRNLLSEVWAQDGWDNLASATILDERALSETLAIAMESDHLTPKCHDNLMDYANALKSLTDIPLWAIKSKSLMYNTLSLS